jgi:hypothetical protein
LARTTRELDICAIIKACGEYGVKKFEQGSLRIFFELDPPLPPEVSGSGYDRVEFRKEVEENKTLGDRDEALARELQTEEMLLLDPENFEKLQRGEEI